jgi:cell division septal protein FtsQ
MKKGGIVFILGVGIAFIVSLWGLGWGFPLVSVLHLEVNKIEVQGYHHIDQKQILEAASVPLRTPILKLNLKGIAQRVESLPWVRSCEARRILPDTLLLRIVEREPMALLLLGRVYYVDEDGTPFKEPSSGETLDFPIITGLTVQDWKKKAGIAEVQEALIFLKEVHNFHHLSKEGISEVHRNEFGELTIFTVKKGVRIKMGRGDTQLKLKRLEEVWKRIVTKQIPVKYIVCEHPDRIVVGLEERG